ncbi:cupin domain-containing protein [Fuscibacter oryzae]|uniref:DUF861 domain-containing protein n=1 Tax=Fuscibacter oryzae TaxID=2803939 RepID=A0A8J7SW25_9RHOB|nr:cupin domain-containing protein [Fuscibacter oryzae]MBL4928464.1 DUF861 domain-containing protein [Fuscibacter oryzae]
MTSRTILHQTDITNAPLIPAGQRKGRGAGDPQLRVMPIDTGSSGRIGLWECAPGGWPVIDRIDTEVCYTLSGRATLTDQDSGWAVEVAQGDLVILSVGWTCRWDVISPVTNIYVIF